MIRVIQGYARNHSNELKQFSLIHIFYTHKSKRLVPITIHRFRNCQFVGYCFVSLRDLSSRQFIDVSFYFDHPRLCVVFSSKSENKLNISTCGRYMHHACAQKCSVLHFNFPYDCGSIPGVLRILSEANAGPTSHLFYTTILHRGI